MTRTRVCLFLVFLSLVAESPLMYGVKPGEINTPLRTVFDVFYAPSPLKFPLFFFVVVGLLVTSLVTKKKPRPAAPMSRALFVSVGALCAWAVLGLLRGGVFAQIPWQIFSPICFLLFGVVLAEALRTTADLEALGKVVVAAGVWRSLVAVVYYATVVRHITDYSKIPAYMTTHDDTTLFVTTVALLVANVIHRSTKRAVLSAVVLTPLVLMAIQLNNRRLAWVSLIGVVVVFYAMLKPSKARRRVNRALIIGAPLLLLYLAVGWGRTERIFKPIQAIQSLDSKKDSSSASRDAENDGLVVSFGQSFWSGTGFGHKYVEVNNTYSLDGVFDQWAYIPHNSLLGLVAFMGLLGFFGAWMPLPVSVFLNGRAYRLTKKPIEQTAAMVGVAEVVIYANQMYGDMGFGSQIGLVLVVSAYASAARLAVLTDAWPATRRAHGAKKPTLTTSTPSAMEEPVARTETAAR